MEHGRGVRGENSRSWLTGMALSLATLGPVSASFGLAAEPTRASASEDGGSAIADEVVLRPKEPVVRRTEPMRRIEGETVEGIRASLRQLDDGELLDLLVGALVLDSPDPKATEIVLQHFKKLTHILEGKRLSYLVSDDDVLLRGEASAHVVLIRSLAEIAMLFPRYEPFDFQVSKTKFSRLGAIAGLQTALDANAAAVSKIATGDRQDIDADLVLSTARFLISNEKGTIDGATLCKRNDSGEFAALTSSLMQSAPVQQDLLAASVVLFDIASAVSKGWDIEVEPTVRPILERADIFERISPFLGRRYLECVLSLRHGSLAEIKENGLLAAQYVSGLLDNGEPNASIALRSLAELRGVLDLDEKIIDDLLVLNRHTGFLQVSRLRDLRHDALGIGGADSGSAIRVLLAEAAQFIRDPSFAAHTKIAIFSFAITDDSLDAAAIFGQVRDNGYVVIPAELRFGGDLNKVCGIVAEVAKRSIDLLVMITDQDVQSRGKSGGLALGVAVEREWFAQNNWSLYEQASSAGALPKLDSGGTSEASQTMRRFSSGSLEPGVTRREAVLLRPQDCRDFGSALTSRSQVVLIGSDTASGPAERIAEAIHRSSGADAWGSEAPITGVALVFSPEGDGYRIGDVVFGFHGPTPAGMEELPPPFKKIGSKFFGRSSEAR